MKNKIIELIDALREELTDNAYIKIANAGLSLPDDEPTTIQFRYPVPDGYEVVIEAPDSDPRKVVTDIQEPDELGDTACKVDGKWMVLDTSDLFLRQVEKKVWVVEWSDIGRSVFYSKLEALNWIDSQDNEATIYEATLKQVK